MHFDKLQFHLVPRSTLFIVKAACTNSLSQNDHFSVTSEQLPQSQYLSPQQQYHQGPGTSNVTKPGRLIYSSGQTSANMKQALGSLLCAFVIFVSGVQGYHPNLLNLPSSNSRLPFGVEYGLAAKDAKMPVSFC